MPDSSESKSTPQSEASGPCSTAASKSKPDDELHDLISRLDSLSIPQIPISSRVRERSPSPDMLGSVDALTARFKTIFNHAPQSVARSSAPVQSDTIDPRIFLAQQEQHTDSQLAKSESGTGKERIEVDDEEFEKALQELSLKEWEMSPDDLQELKMLESTVVLDHTQQQNANERNGNKYLNPDYLKVIANDLDSKAIDEEPDFNEKSLLRDAQKNVKDSKELISEAQKESSTLDGRSQPSEEPIAFSKEKVPFDQEEFNKEKKDIEDQADRLVSVLSAASNEDTTPEEVEVSDTHSEGQDTDQEADELVDMYIKLGSDDGSEAELSQSDKEQIHEDKATEDLFARLQALQRPPTTGFASLDIEKNSRKPSNSEIAELPDAPSLSYVMPSPPMGNRRDSKLRQDAELGCCMCSHDVEYRCFGCERDDEDNYLYCGKCFLLTHLGEQAGFEERMHRYAKVSII
ncbi:uncharacterized protein V1516DRAFT_618529 [Lipomyces oligophaga]|uniref:uncharacterized protein n=1 Tax=Lipomyces oligophaga TaxID=45792 RepID=UPI0034CEDA0F